MYAYFPVPQHRLFSDEEGCATEQTRQVQKRRKGSSIPFVFFCLIILAGSAWIGYSVWQRKQVPQESNGNATMTVTMTDAMANQLMQTLLPEDLPLSNAAVRFLNGKIGVSGTIEADQIINQTVEVHYPELAMVKSLLPDQVAFDAVFAVKAENGALKVTPDAFRLAEFPIPLGLLPKELKNMVGALLVAQIDKTGFSVTEIQCTQGSVTVRVK